MGKSRARNMHLEWKLGTMNIGGPARHPVRPWYHLISLNNGRTSLHSQQINLASMMSRNDTLGDNEAAGSNLQSPASWETVRSGALSLRKFGLSGSETLPVMAPHSNDPIRTSPRKLSKLGSLFSISC